MFRIFRFGIFRPTACFERLVDIDRAELGRLGYRVLLFDVDNTITCWNSGDIAPEVREWFAGLSEFGLKGCIISNNSASRLEPLAADLGIDYLAKARKPLPFGYHRAMRQMGSSRQNTLMIGDQLLTDILGANLAGVDSVLVTPIDLSREFRWTYVNRRIERIIKKPTLRGVPKGHF